MGLKDDVRQRRHQKIKNLLELYQEAPKPLANSGGKTGEEGEVAIWPAKPMEKGSPDELAGMPQGPVNRHVPGNVDPELAWKRNPNPWTTWEGEAGGASGRSFVKPKPEDGYMPPPRNWSGFRKELKWKFILSIVAFGAVWGMFQINHSLAERGQAFVKQALTEEMDFAAAAGWYKQVFAGAPSFIPMFEGHSGTSVGVDGEVKRGAVAPLRDGALVRTFAEMLNGIELSGASEAEVLAAETGRIIFVAEQQDSVLIQHAGNMVTIYGKLGETNVETGDWVEAGDAIGKLRQMSAGEPSLLYFGVKRQDQYVDPLDVIAVD